MDPVVLVTGTSTGIGRAAVAALAARGCTVVATARDVNAIADLEADRVNAMRLDVTNEAQRVAVMEATLSTHGRLDAIVNNAGHGAYLPVEATPLRTFRSMLEVNLLGPHRLTQLALPHMRRQRSGRIVNVSSVAGHIAVPMIGAYAATKHALGALTQSLRMEVRPFGIHACLVEPGAIGTQFGARASREAQAAAGDADPGGGGGPYGELEARWGRVVGRGRTGPDAVARQIAHACTARRPRRHYVSTVHGRLGRAAAHVVPQAAREAVMRAWLRQGRR